MVPSLLVLRLRLRVSMQLRMCQCLLRIRMVAMVRAPVRMVQVRVRMVGIDGLESSGLLVGSRWLQVNNKRRNSSKMGHVFWF